MIRLLTILFVSAFSMTAMASIQCAGETYSGTIVTVSVRTVGAVGAPADGRVSITPRTSAARSFTLEQNEIVQFYESINGSRAIVGLGAYEQTNYPVKVRYVGPNYSGDLVRVLRNPYRRRYSGNEMRVWMGPGHTWSQQFVFADVVCNVQLDP